MKAEEFQRVGERLFYWEAYDPSVKTSLSCCAVRTGEGLVFIDPIPLAQEAWAELLESAPVAAVVLTSGNHLRAGRVIAQRLGVPLRAHAAALAELGIVGEATPLAEGESVAGDLHVYEVPGAATGEIALYSAATGLHFGDAVINIEPYGFALLPEKYCEDQAAMRAALRKLSALEFSLITSAHGLPMVKAAKERFAALVGGGL